MEPITRARAFQFVELGEDGADDAGGSRASAHVLFRNALREARDLGRFAPIGGGGAGASRAPRPARPRRSRRFRTTACISRRRAAGPTTCC